VWIIYICINWVGAPCAVWMSVWLCGASVSAVWDEMTRWSKSWLVGSHHLDERRRRPPGSSGRVTYASGRRGGRREGKKRPADGGAGMLPPPLQQQRGREALYRDPPPLTVPRPPPHHPSSGGMRRLCSTGTGSETSWGRSIIPVAWRCGINQSSNHSLTGLYHIAAKAIQIQ